MCRRRQRWRPRGNGDKAFTFRRFDGIFVGMGTPTLGSRLGTTTHLSPLLHKARRLGLGPA